MSEDIKKMVKDYIKFINLTVDKDDVSMIKSLSLWRQENLIIETLQDKNLEDVVLWNRACIILDEIRRTIIQYQQLSWYLRLWYRITGKKDHHDLMIKQLKMFAVRVMGTSAYLDSPLGSNPPKEGEKCYYHQIFTGRW